jgi:deoxyribonuclease V
MKIPAVPHRWALSPRAAIAVQRKLAGRVLQAQPVGDLRFVAGLDAAFSSDERYCLAAVVLWELHAQQVIEQHTAERALRFPYVPGLLSFREAPALLAALRKLRHPPDVLLCDGQGLAHPRRFGIACHVGVICDLPALGCAKSRLVGEHDEPAPLRGERVPLLDRGETIGSVLRTQDGVRPVFVSVGHKLDLPTAEQIVLTCATKYRLPEPTRLADQLVGSAKRARAAR